MDEKLYKTSVERAEESTRDPIVKLAELLKAERFATEEDLAAILDSFRAWALANGHEISAKGRIPASVREAFDEVR